MEVGVAGVDVGGLIGGNCGSGRKRTCLRVGWLVGTAERDAVGGCAGGDAGGGLRSGARALHAAYARALRGRRGTSSVRYWAPS